MLGLKLGILSAQARGNGLIDHVEVKLIPVSIDLRFGHGEPRALERAGHLARGFLLARKLPSEQGVESDVLPYQVFAQTAGLYAPQIGQGVVAVAQSGLAVAHQVDQTQPRRPAISTAARISPRTRR